MDKLEKNVKQQDAEGKSIDYTAWKQHMVVKWHLQYAG